MIFAGCRFLFEVFAEKKRRKGANHDSWTMLTPFIQQALPALPFCISPFLMYLRVLLHMGKDMEEMHR